MLKQVLLLLLSVVGLALAAQQKSYSGHQVLRTEPLTELQAHALSNLQASSLKFDFWKDPVIGRPAEVRAAPENVEELLKIFRLHRVKYTTKIQDVDKLIQLSKVKGTRKLHSAAVPAPRYSLNWDDYPSHKQINEFIDELAATHPAFVKTASLGKSYEGRDIRVIQITKAGAGKPNVFVEAGIHAREWIANAVATYTIRELVEKDADHPQYLNNFNFHIIPMANPDGYEFSRSDDRLWRKSRTDFNSTLGCKGVDLNRNWPYHWGESGSSTNKCSDIYAGEAPLSDVESQHISRYFRALTPKPELSICFHSAAELWLYPYGYAYNAYPSNVEEIKSLANNAVAALNKVHNQTFKVINSAELYPAAGASDDWYQSEGSRFTYTPELRDNGYGFVLPPNLIIPSGEEVWAAWKSMLDTLIKEMKH
jgi:predicted deacylase